MNETEEVKQTEQETLEIPAGFWLRVSAYMIDGIIFLPTLILGLMNMFVWKNLFFAILLFMPGLIYKPLMESFKGATLGKMACGIRVIDKDGRNISIMSAYIRFIPFLLAAVPGMLMAVSMFSHPEFKAVTNLMEFGKFSQTLPQPLWQQFLNWILFIDCLVIVFNKKKCAIHDMIARSFCVKKKGKKIPIIAKIIIIFFILLPIIGLLAAIAIPNFIIAKSRAQANVCAIQLRNIMRRKQAWANDNNITDNAVIPTWTDLSPKYIKKELTICPAGGTYTINDLNSSTTCSIGDNNTPDPGDDHTVDNNKTYSE